MRYDDGRNSKRENIEIPNKKKWEYEEEEINNMEKMHMNSIFVSENSKPTKKNLEFMKSVVNFYFFYYTGRCLHEISREICFVELNLSWCCIFVDLIQRGSIFRIWSFDSLSVERLHLILRKWSMWCSWSWLNAYAWFREVKHVMFLKFESWKQVYIFIGASIFEVGRL